MDEVVQETEAGIEKQDTIAPETKQTFQDDYLIEADPETDGIQIKTTKSIREALSDLFSWNNYKVYLLTAWTFSAFAVLPSFFNLYLRSLSWDYLTIGLVSAIWSGVAAVCRLIGGYVGDVVDRKKLSVTALFIAAVYHLIMGLFVDFTLIFVGIMIYSSIDIVKGGSSAYIMDNIPKEHSGLALSLFTAGRSFGVFTLVLLGMMIPFVGFGSGIRTLYLFCGLLLLICTIVRAIYLESSSKVTRDHERSLWQDFWRENKRAAKVLVTTIPVIMIVVVIDSMSDALFRFGALIYTNEVLGVSYEGIITILLLTLIIQTPLLLIVGRYSDKNGVRKTSVIIYSIMPISVSLLLIAPMFPYWVPEGLYYSAESTFPGLGAVFTLPFLSILLKTINDTLWWLILLTLIRRSLPQRDTAKFLAIFWSIIYICTSIGPVIAGLIYTYIAPSSLFLSVLLINLLIMMVLVKGNLGEKRDDYERPKKSTEDSSET